MCEEFHITCQKPTKGKENYLPNCNTSKMVLTFFRNEKKSFSPEDMAIPIRFGYKIFYNGMQSNKLESLYDAVYEGKVEK